MKCAKCGQKIGNDQKFCRYCGAPVLSKASVPVTEGDGRTKGSAAGKIVIAVVAVAALSLVVFTGFYLADRHGMFGRDSDVKVASDLEDAGSGRAASGGTETAESMRQGATGADGSPSAVGTGGTGAEITNPDGSPSAVGREEIDVEEMVSQIRDRYKEIVSGISADSYDITMISEGITAYSGQGQIRAIVAQKGYGDPGYARYFYYDGGELFFAYYEGNDSHRLYFDGNRLLRWRYCPDASDSGSATNHDLEDTPEYFQRENGTMEESESLLDAWGNAPANGTGAQEYILAGSDTRYLSISELEGFTADQCRLARNEIYARHGRIFDDEYLQEYFNAKEWYVPSIAPGDFEESLLNPYEIANRDLIVEYEKEHGLR